MVVTNIREVELLDLDRCYEIETVSYQGDEAASKEKIKKRIENYPTGFIIIELAGKIAGFINSGATHQMELSDEEFKELIGHDAKGQHLVIMSVVVHPDYQGRGYAHLLLKAFIAKMTRLNKSSIHLICQTSLVDMYAKHGFVYQGQSESEHGGLQWHEMVLHLPN